jgi:hypothetical protein
VIGEKISCQTAGIRYSFLATDREREKERKKEIKKERKKERKKESA